MKDPARFENSQKVGGLGKKREYKMKLVAPSF